MSRVIVFDLDGTLVDSRRDIAESANLLLESFGAKPLPEETIGRMVGDGAPTLVARGRGAIAEKILELAEQHDVAVTRDPTLVAVLGALDIGEEIPPDLYGVIAEVLAWAYHADKQAGAKRLYRDAA